MKRIGSSVCDNVQRAIGREMLRIPTTKYLGSVVVKLMVLMLAINFAKETLELSNVTF